MELYFCFRYTWGYETPRDPATTGEASPTGHPVGESGEKTVGRRPLGGGIQKFGVPMVRSVPKEWRGGPSPQTDSGAAAKAHQAPEAQVGEPSAVGTIGARLSNRTVDLEAHCPVGPETVSRSLSPPSRVALASSNGMELPEARPPGSTTGRSGDCALEAVPLAAYKKTPSDVAPIWSSSMNRASCSSPTWPAPGPQKDKRRSFTISTNRTGSRQSAPCRSLPNEDGWPSIFSVAPAISRDWMCKPSSNTCSGIFGDRWSCCGIEDPSIGAGKSSSGSTTVPGSRWNRSRPTPPNSTRPNMSGARRIARWPTVHRGTWSSLTDGSRTRSDESVGRKHSFGPVSTLPIYPGPDKLSFLYLCEPQ